MGVEILPAREGRALALKAGQSIRIVNTHGQQVVDFWAFNALDLHEFLSMEHLRAGLGRIFVRVGDGLLSNRRRAILTLVEDSSPGVHDTLIAACDPDRYRLLGCEGYHASCRENLFVGMKALGLEPPLCPSPLNLWMNIPVAADGSVAFEPPVSMPGDYLTLRAEMDCVVAMSACPQDMVPINGAECRPMDAAFELLDGR